MSQCCATAGVRPDCLDVCETPLHELDLDYFGLRSRCFGELDKIMGCASGENRLKMVLKLLLVIEKLIKINAINQN